MNDLGDWFSRNSDNILLNILAVVAGGLISWLFFLRGREPKTLDYAIISEHSIGVGAEQQMPTYLEFNWKVPVDPQDRGGAFELHTLTNPRITQILIKNTGKRAIDVKDFKQPIRVSVPDGCWLVDLSTIEAAHEAIIDYGPIDPELPYNPKAPARVQRSHGQPDRAFRPALLNSGDWMRMQVLTDGTAEPPTVTCWIIGQSRPMRRRQEILEEPFQQLALQRLREFFTWETLNKAGGALLAAILIIAVIVAIQDLS